MLFVFKLLAEGLSTYFKLRENIHIMNVNRMTFAFPMLFFFLSQP